MTLRADAGSVTASTSKALLARVEMDRVNLGDDQSSVGSILGYAMEQVQAVGSTCDRILSMLQYSDPVRYELLVKLYFSLAASEHKIESALTGGQG